LYILIIWTKSRSYYQPKTHFLKSCSTKSYIILSYEIKCLTCYSDVRFAQERVKSPLAVAALEQTAEGIRQRRLLENWEERLIARDEVLVFFAGLYQMSVSRTKQALFKLVPLFDLCKINVNLRCRDKKQPTQIKCERTQLALPFRELCVKEKQNTVAQCTFLSRWQKAPQK